MKKSWLVISLASTLLALFGCAQQPTSTASTSSATPATTATPSVATQAQTTVADTTAAAKEVAQETKDAAVEKTQAAVASGKTAVTEVVTTAKETANAAATTAKTTASNAATTAKTAATNATTAAKTAATNVTTAVTTAATSATSGASITTMPDWITTPTYDCKGCHAIDKKVIGPAWRDVAKKYKGDAGAEAMLIQKVKNGGKGNWTSVTGGVPMTPHPKLTDAELKKVVDFVLSLD